MPVVQIKDVKMGEKCRLVTRSDFDGLVCAALLKEFRFASAFSVIFLLLSNTLSA